MSYLTPFFLWCIGCGPDGLEEPITSSLFRAFEGLISSGVKTLTAAGFGGLYYIGLTYCCGIGGHDYLLIFIWVLNALINILLAFLHFLFHQHPNIM